MPISLPVSICRTRNGSIQKSRNLVREVQWKSWLKKENKTLRGICDHSISSNHFEFAVPVCTLLVFYTFRAHKSFWTFVLLFKFSVHLILLCLRSLNSRSFWPFLVIGFIYSAKPMQSHQAYTMRLGYRR